MNLNDYLQLPDSRSVSELRVLIKAKSEAQIRQWQHGYAGRRPNWANRVALEHATGGKVNVEEWGADCKCTRLADPAWPHPGGRPLLDIEVAKSKAEAWPTAVV
ncbi:Cro-like transcriptional regulator [Variovorax phage VarioGold]|uniref:hypothetical protein n=1 Tax=Variovorax sp. ZS18.2.2 TaxID=2971255 RepID=UPI0021512E17|nr:hypothetical protein [Variovorax sp. ZS18.2.2]MCR6477544.1 hypothetical protein [Variovorax sp. ZS18.2.2]UYD72093.1 Cro-like transcriptional regulator [Variovorax phage VarioGold]